MSVAAVVVGFEPAAAVAVAETAGIAAEAEPAEKRQGSVAVEKVH